MSQATLSKAAQTTQGGLGENARKDIAEALSVTLADSYLLYLKTLNVHWNITGGSFKAIHDMTEEQYTDIATAVDEIAERIRALGELAPGSLSEYNDLATIQDNPGLKEMSTDDMLRDLIAGNQALVASLYKASETAAEQGDKVSEDMTIARMQVHEQNIWMLSSMVEE